MAVDHDRGAVYAEFQATCHLEGIAIDPVILGDLLTWLLGRGDWHDGAIAPAGSWDEHERRERVITAVLDVAKARRQALPDRIAVDLMTWIHDVKGWNA